MGREAAWPLGAGCGRQCALGSCFRRLLARLLSAEKPRLPVFFVQGTVAALHPAQHVLRVAVSSGLTSY